VLDRDRTINWWIGRATDAELSAWTGMAQRAVGVVLALPTMRAGVTGGGRGKKTTRRLDPKVRNSVAVIHALNVAGIPFELAANIIATTPFLASVMTPVVDYSEVGSGVRSLAQVDPQGGYLPSDIVPQHVWDRHVLPCQNVRRPSPQGPNDICFVELSSFENYATNGTLFVSEDRELKPITDRPVYYGEIDPFGLFSPHNTAPEAIPRFDDHLLIVNGRWVFHRQPDPDPQEQIEMMLDGLPKEERGLSFRIEPISAIEDDRKTVRSLFGGRDKDEERRARYHLRNAESILDVNMTLAVRTMKRRALGLDVSIPEG